MKKSPILHDHCLIHVKHVERTLGLDSKHFQIFASSLTKFRKGMISNSALVSNVTNLFGPRYYLNQCFQTFIPPNLQQGSNTHDHDDHIDQQPSAKRPENSADFSAKIQRVTEFLNKVRERIKDDDPGVLKRFLDFLSTCYDNRDDHMAAAKEVQKEFDLIFKHHPDLSIDFTRFMVDFYITDESEEAWESIKNGRKDESLHISEEKHPCNEMLFEVDDDHCDYDVVCNLLESTRRRIKKFYRKTKKQRDGPVAIENFLSTVNFRCIEKLYGLTEDDEGHGQEIIQQLRVNPIKATKIIKKRLGQKLKILKCEGAKAKKIWVEARKNCHMILEGDQ